MPNMIKLKMEKKIKSKYGLLSLNIFTYCNNNRLALQLYTEDGELFDDLTINLSNFLIADIDEGFLNSFINSKEFDIVSILKKEGTISESYGLRNYNFGQYEYVKFNLENLKQYDPKGFKKFMSKQK